MSQGAVEYHIEPYFCAHDLYHGWHLYANDQWVRGGSVLASTVVRLLGEHYPYLPVCDELLWWDDFVHRFVEKYPQGITLTEGG